MIGYLILIGLLILIAIDITYYIFKNSCRIVGHQVPKKEVDWVHYSKDYTWFECKRCRKRFDIKFDANNKKGYTLNERKGWM